MVFSSKHDIVKHLRSHAYTCDRAEEKPFQLELCKASSTWPPDSAPESETHLAFGLTD